MNEESIAIGSYEKGVIQCFNRQSLLTTPHVRFSFKSYHQQILQNHKLNFTLQNANHGQPLQYLKFSSEYLLSASNEMVKIWDKQATTMVFSFLIYLQN